MPGGRIIFHPKMGPIQMLKNHRLQGMTKPSSVGLGSSTEVVTGMTTLSSVVVVGGGVVCVDGDELPSPSRDVTWLSPVVGWPSDSVCSGSV